MVILHHEFQIRRHVPDGIRLMLIVVQQEVHHVDVIQPNCIGLNMAVILLEGNRADVGVGIMVVVLEVKENRWA